VTLFATKNELRYLIQLTAMTHWLLLSFVWCYENITDTWTVWI